MIKFLDKWLPLKGSSDELIRLTLFGRLVYSIILFIGWPLMAIVVGIHYDSVLSGIFMFIFPLIATIGIVGLLKLIS